MRFGLVFLSIFLPLLVSAAGNGAKVARKPAGKSAPMYIGHNLTPSTEVLRAKAFTLGNYAAGFGITENLLVATSPWIWYSYNTLNLHLKYSQAVNTRATFGFFVSYFDSYNSENLGGNGIPGSSGITPLAGEMPTGVNVSKSLNRYQWTSYSMHGLYSYVFENGVTEYFNLKYSYFVNDEMPYSLRMDPGDDSIRDQIDASTLVRIPIRSGVGLGFEAGVLGANYVTPFAYLGASVAIQADNCSVQLGASYTVPVSELGTSKGMEVGRMDQRVHYSEVARQYYTERYIQVAVHPEVQFQYNF